MSRAMPSNTSATGQEKPWTTVPPPERVALGEPGDWSIVGNHQYRAARRIDDPDESSAGDPRWFCHLTRE